MVLERDSCELPRLHRLLSDDESEWHKNHPMSLQDIHPVLITRDAAMTIERALKSLEPFPQVIVYDNGSSDRTLEICERFPNVKVTTGEFFGFGSTKNHAVRLAEGDWVLSIDADEYLSAELLDSLRAIDLGDPTVAYAVERRNFFMGKIVEHGGWGHQWLVRLFNRRYCRFNDALVHEKVLVPDSCTTVRFRGPLWHEAVADLDQVLHKISRYSELNRLDGGRTHSTANILLRTYWSFLKTYVLRAGFREGWRGVAMATFDAMGTFCKHMKRYADEAIEAEKRQSGP
jgi:glycosyltransferase involved in cell wall biosynthesis